MHGYSQTDMWEYAKNAVIEARNDEREDIACYLEAFGYHNLAGQIFAGMTRSINEDRRGLAIQANLLRKNKEFL